MNIANEKDREAEVAALFLEREQIMERLKAIDTRMKVILLPRSQEQRKRSRMPMRDIIRAGRAL